MRSAIDAPNVHARSLVKSSFLSGLYVSHQIQPEDVIRILNATGVGFVLVGAHGLGGWIGAPRATEDIDVVVTNRHVKKAVKALLAAFPILEAVDLSVVTRLRVSGTDDVAIDVMKPNQPVVAAALKNTVTVRSGDNAYKVPTLEMALAMKFAPMVSLLREDEKKHYDAGDFIRMVKHNPDIDLAKLAELGELVYPGGGKEVVEMVRRVRAGESLTL